MKKMLLMALFAATSLLFSGHAFPSRQVTTAVKPSSRLLVYVWYLNYELTDATGSVLEVNAELTRLRNLHPMYTFSATGDIGLYEFEFGDFANQPIKIIYSNLW